MRAHDPRPTGAIGLVVDPAVGITAQGDRLQAHRVRGRGPALGQTRPGTGGGLDALEKGRLPEPLPRSVPRRGGPTRRSAARAPPPLRFTPTCASFHNVPRNDLPAAHPVRIPRATSRPIVAIAPAVGPTKKISSGWGWVVNRPQVAYPTAVRVTAPFPTARTQRSFHGGTLVGRTVVAGQGSWNHGATPPPPPRALISGLPHAVDRTLAPRRSCSCHQRG